MSAAVEEERQILVSALDSFIGRLRPRATGRTANHHACDYVADDGRRLKIAEDLRDRIRAGRWP
jgi:hypothetical protein